MREYRYELEPQDQKKLFFWSWYHAPQLRWQRLFAGPACLALSALFLFHRASGNYYLVGMALAAAGMFYLYRPYFQYHRAKHDGLRATLLLTSREFRYKDEANESTIDASSIISIAEGKRYMFLGLKLEKLMYIPFDLERLEDRQDFMARLRRMTGSE